MSGLPLSYLQEFLAPLLAAQYESADVERIMAGCSMQRAVTMRVNALRATREKAIAQLDAAGIQWKPVTWYDDALIVEGAREGAIRDLPVYRNGEIYLQSLSAMIPALVLRAMPGEDVCDMCAAPGGKTSQISALADGKAFITACEMHAPRAEKLKHNLVASLFLFY